MALKPKSRRGFASMDKAKQRAIASKGGKSAHAMGRAHKFNAKEASRASKIAHDRGTAHEFDSHDGRLAGRKGGLARAATRQRRVVMPQASLLVDPPEVPAVLTPCDDEPGRHQ